MYFFMVPGILLSCFSRLWLFQTPWTFALQDPPSIGFSKQEYWNGLPSPPSGDLPDPRVKPISLMSPYLTGRFFTTSATWKNVSLKLKLAYAQSLPTLRPHDWLYPSRFLCPWNFPGKNTGVGCHFLLQGIFLTQGSNSLLLHWQVDSLPLHHLRRHINNI